jgi:outer membrane protein insertion porin family
VKTSIQEGSELNTKVIDISVEEKPTGEIMVGAGAGTDGATVGFSVTENNFLGKGIRLGTSLDVTEDSLKGSFTVTNPNFNYTDKSLSTTVESQTTDKMADNGYESTKTGFSIGTGFEQFENLYFTPSISNYYEDLSTNTSASKNLKKQSGSYIESTFSYGLDYDMRNQSFQTTEGFRSSFRQSIPLISDEYALGNTYNYKTWYKLPNNMVTSLGFYGRTVNSMTGDNVRITNRFWIPRKKLKGFKTRAIGPVDNKDYVGGNYGAALNFDTTLPMFFSTLETIDVKYFIDTANLWGVDYDSTIDQSNTIRASTGLAVDWFTPIGPLNFSLAQDLSKAPADKTEIFQFSLGTTF